MPLGEWLDGVRIWSPTEALRVRAQHENLRSVELPEEMGGAVIVGDFLMESLYFAIECALTSTMDSPVFRITGRVVVKVADGWEEFIEKVLRDVNLVTT